MFKKLHDDHPAVGAEDYRSVSAEDWARFRIETTRREVARLLAAVELGTEYGLRLQSILENTLSQIEDLARDADKGEAEAGE